MSGSFLVEEGMGEDTTGRGKSRSRCEREGRPWCAQRTRGTGV